jgi:hemerythrin-like domain-containing protein
MLELFIAHQVLIMRGHIADALHLLKKFQELQIQHIRDEEELLIPLYQKHISPLPPGGAIEFYLREHRQIERLIDRLFVRLNSWTGPSDVKLVEQFDLCFRFKDLIDHHDARERVFMYRLLDQKLSAAKQRDIMDRFSQNVHRYYA